MSSITRLPIDPRTLSTLELDERVNEHGKCSGRIDDARFFPPGVITSRVAREACKGCPVVAECLERALRREARTVGRPEGIFGATSPRQRRLFLQQMAVA